VVKRIGDSNAEEIRRANRYWGARNFNARVPPDLGAETPADRTLLSSSAINAARGHDRSDIDFQIPHERREKKGRAGRLGRGFGMAPSASFGGRHSLLTRFAKSKNQRRAREVSPPPSPERVSVSRL